MRREQQTESSRMALQAIARIVGIDPQADPERIADATIGELVRRRAIFGKPFTPTLEDIAFLDALERWDAMPYEHWRSMVRSLRSRIAAALPERVTCDTKG